MKWKVMLVNAPSPIVEGSRVHISDSGHLLIYKGSETVAYFNAMGWTSCVLITSENSEQIIKQAVEKAVEDKRPEIENMLKMRGMA